MGVVDALFEVTDERLKALYHRAWLEENRGSVDTRKHPELDKAIYLYARKHNCSYDKAMIFAKTGKKLGRLADQ